MEKFIKRSLIQAKTATHIKQLLAEMTALGKERAARRCQPATQLKRGGVLYASEARVMARQKKEEGGTQLERAIIREAELKKELQMERNRVEKLRTYCLELMEKYE
jgi:hypothetical protein